jgi:hypothetical protein
MRLSSRYRQGATRSDFIESWSLELGSRLERRRAGFNWWEGKAARRVGGVSAGRPEPCKNELTGSKRGEGKSKPAVPLTMSDLTSVMLP